MNELEKFITLVKNGYFMTHYLDIEGKSVYQAYTLGGDVIKSRDGNETVIMAYNHLMKRLLAKEGTVTNLRGLSDQQLMERYAALKQAEQQLIDTGKQDSTEFQAIRKGVNELWNSLIIHGWRWVESEAQWVEMAWVDKKTGERILAYDETHPSRRDVEQERYKNGED